MKITASYNFDAPHDDKENVEPKSAAFKQIRTVKGLKQSLGIPDAMFKNLSKCRHIAPTYESIDDKTRRDMHRFIVAVADVAM